MGAITTRPTGFAAQVCCGEAVGAPHTVCIWWAPLTALAPFLPPLNISHIPQIAPAEATTPQPLLWGPLTPCHSSSPADPSPSSQLSASFQPQITCSPARPAPHIGLPCVCPRPPRVAAGLRCPQAPGQTRKPEAAAALTWLALLSFWLLIRNSRQEICRASSGLGVGALPHLPSSLSAGIT